MKLKERLSGIWLMSMVLLSLCAYTVFFVAQMWLNILHAGYLGLAILQCTTLTIYLFGPEKLKKKPLKALYRILYATTFLVIPAFVFIFMGLLSQYHADIPEATDASFYAVEDIVPGEKTTIYDTGKVYIFFPEYTDIDLVCGKRPSKSDDSITWCSGAAFQHTVSFKYNEIDVEGDHAVNGKLYESPYNKDAFAAFTCVDGEFKFEFDDPSGAIREAAEKGGSGFMQFGLIKDGEEVMNFDRPRARCYRALAELNGEVCIIDSTNMMHFDEFMNELHRLGVTNAVYMDMGAGWNYSWYRKPSGKSVTLFGLSVPWSHNWVVFK